MGEYQSYRPDAKRSRFIVRAFATGIFNAGSNVGAILAPLAVPIIALTWGWQAAFLFTGVLSAAWLVTWLSTYRPPDQHPKLAAAELAYIRSDPPEPAARIPWSQLLKHRQAWAFIAAKFMTDPIWWFFLFWLPKFLNSEYGLTLTKIGPPLIAIYLLADVGSIGGGWLAGRLMPMLRATRPMSSIRRSATSATGS